MKDQVIEAAGKTWQLLGQQGEADLATISRSLQENDSVVYQALGWLAREDKISYTTKENQTFVSLVQSELEAFKNLMPETPAAKARQPRRSAKRIK